MKDLDRGPVLLGLAVGCLLILSGCATAPRSERVDSRDPFERFNRSTYRFNSAVDRAVLKPVAVAYRDHVPQVVRTGVKNLLDNIGYPTVILNDFLQGKAVAGLEDTARLLVNTAFGLGGLLDPASTAGLDRNDEDFGQTLGRWGVPAGPYLIIPFAGPSTVRDAPGLYVDSRTQLDELLADEVEFFDKDSVDYGLIALNVVDSRAELLRTERVLRQAYDEYAFVRNAWLQRREFQVSDGEVPEEEEFDEE